MPVALSSAESGPKFRVAICGAGIAGLALAITIGKYDPSIPIDIYEAHDSIETAGVGITLQRHEMLAELGLFDDLKQIFTQSPGSSLAVNFRRSDIPEGGYAWYQVNRNGAAAMHRQHMIAILEKHLPASCTVHSRKRLINYTEPGQQDTYLTSPIILKFQDGTTATADLLVGADGVRSTVRKALFEAASEDKSDGDKTDLKQYIEAIFTGMVIYRNLIPAETLRKEDPENLSLRELMCYSGKGKAFVTYPIAKGTIINFAAVVGDPKLTGTRFDGHWVSDANRDELAKSFDDFEPGAKEVAKLCDKPSKWALHVVKPLPFCVRNRVALIGDACHAMTPHHGAGAGEAMEDAFVLGRLIAHPLTVLSRIPDALRVYEEVRLPLAREVARLSLSTGWMGMFMEPGYYDGARKEGDLDDSGISAYEREGMETIKQETDRRTDWIERSDDVLWGWEEAKSKLEALVN